MTLNSHCSADGVERHPKLPGASTNAPASSASHVGESLADGDHAAVAEASLVASCGVRGLAAGGVGGDERIESGRGGVRIEYLAVMSSA